MLTVTEISCCPGIIGVDNASAPGLRASVLYTGIGGGSPASPTIIASSSCSNVSLCFCVINSVF